MAWALGFHEAAAEEFVALPTEHGLEKLPSKLTKHIESELWQFRLKGQDGIARALYVTRSDRRIIVVRIFTKKTQKTPRREIELALGRAEEVA